ncbi:unnamed protein product, partial [Gongylonema pulchrum]|uniref:Uncharacterized protein n=1 Tax=Gongylonema pulchrum TaxID=637853 RepID=A0A183DS87_9BILA
MPVRETGLVLEVRRDFGRILSPTNFSMPNIHIYFSLSTFVNDSMLSTITDNLADLFQCNGGMGRPMLSGLYRVNRRQNNFAHQNQPHPDPDYFQCNGGMGRPMLSGLYRVNRRQNNFAHQNQPHPAPMPVRETGLVLEVRRDFGRVLSPTNFSMPNIHIYFSLATFVNDSMLSTITDNLADLFQVEIEFERSPVSRDTRGFVHTIFTCTSIKPAAEIGLEPELVPMIVIQNNGEIPLALMMNHELVALPRQIFPVEEVASAFITKKCSATAEASFHRFSLLATMEWPEFAAVGHSVEGRVLNAPPWMHECTNLAIKKIALSIQRFGRDREGFAIVKEHVGHGIVLTAVDEEERRICGELFFPYEMGGDRSHVDSTCYFRACLELPNRKYRYRIYSLDAVEDAVANGLPGREQRFSRVARPAVHWFYWEFFLWIVLRGICYRHLGRDLANVVAEMLEAQVGTPRAVANPPPPGISSADAEQPNLDF